MPWPQGTPQWMITLLDKLSGSGTLHGLPPQVLAAIASNESGFENAGAGINSSGYGGYFGLGVNQKYPGGTITQSVMLTNSPTSFTKQAQVASSEVAYLDKTYAHGNLVQALADYVGGVTHPVYTGEAQIYTQTVLHGHGTNLGVGTGATPNTGTLTSYVQHQSTTQKNAVAAANLGGGTNILAQIDAFLNPGTTKGGFLSFLTVTHDVKTLALLILGRAMFSAFFLGITAIGFYMMVKGPVASVAGLLGGTVYEGKRIQQAGERNRQAAQRISIMETEANTRAAREARLGGTNP